MKKFLVTTLVAAMLFTGAGAVFAADDVPVVQTGLTLADGSHLVMDKEFGYVDKIDGTITVAALKANFASEITVTGADGKVKSDDAAVATDDVIAAGEESLKALIYGDVNRDGKANIGDVSGVLQNVAKWDSNINTDAADVDKSGDVNLVDVTKLLKKTANWSDISLGNVRMVFENKKQTAENEDSTLNLYFTDMMFKIGASNTTHTGEYSHKMKMAKNEHESCQALIYSENAREGLSAELTPFVSEFGDYEMQSLLEWVYYYPDHSLSWPILGGTVWHDGDDLPEVLMPMADTFELRAGKVQHMVITAKSTVDTPAGMYTATLNIKDGDKVIKTATVYAYVWDFALPDAPYSASLIANGSYNGDGKAYYDYMLDNNFSSYVLPYDITDEEADAYMSDPRVTAFVIAGGSDLYDEDQNMYGGMMDESDEDTIANYNKVMSNPDGGKKGLFYYTDEPWGPGLHNVRTTYEYVTKLLGTTNIRNITPLAGNNSSADDQCLNEGIDPVAFIDPYINVWCPQSSAFHLSTEGGTWTPRRYLSKYGEFADRAKAFKEKGEELWWYVCCSPEIPYANLFTWYQGVVIRDLMWQQYFNDVDGFLYYGVGVHWGGISKYQFHIYNGDGVLLFPGEMWGRTGPQASWRLYQLRDGFDDFDYLSMAEEIVGREKVMEIVKKVTTGMLEYTEDYRVLDACRDELVEIILAAEK